MKTYKVIKVDWVDSCTASGWRDRGNLITRHPSHCVSCGIQVRTEKGSIGVTHSISDFDDATDTIIIPRKAIQKIEKITTFKA